MVRQLVVLALVFVATIGMVMAQDAPSASPKSSPSEKASPSPKSSSSPSPSPSPPSSSPPSSSSESPLSSPPSPSEDNDEISDSPAPASDPIELYAPEPEPFDDPFTPEEADSADVADGASTLQLSAATATVAIVVGFFAF